ncbi:MAG: alpha-galactosidase, partial [Pseudomonadota bacterium]
TVFVPLYKSHRILDGKSDMDGLPQARGEAAQTLIVTLEDALHGLEIELRYSIWDDFGVLARSSRLINHSSKLIHLHHAYSSALDLPPDDYDAVHLWGTWSREMNKERVSLPRGRFTIESAKGTSSSTHVPFLALAQKSASESRGRIYASTLVYSGNHSFSAEVGEFDDVRLLVGINPFNFQWQLSPGGGQFTTPEALHVFTDQGFRGMSHSFHEFTRARITPERFATKPRPTYLNTWEAAYFDIDQDKVLRLADKAVELGVDMLVVDDGWFKGRQDDTTSLGNWTADPVRFSKGIPWLAKQVRKKGLKFGLWFEPEMVNPQSDLFKAHPEWALHVPGRKPSLGRNQLTLDLSRSDVVDHLYGQLDVILSCGDIDYVKWDMNRNMTEVGSAALPSDRQQEVAHRYMLGLYSLIDRLTTAYPNVLFENCASGGNRMDLGMLSYFPQTWTSDLCDPVGRLSIINGAGLFLPLDCLAAYVGPSPNHQNGRVTSIDTRFLAGAFNAPRGISLSEADIDQDLSRLQHWMAWAKQTAPDMIGGRFDRLITDDNEVCWQYMTADRATVYLAYFSILSHPNAPFRRARMQGLERLGEYRLEGTDQIFRGDALMESGLPLPYVTTSQTSANVDYMPKGDFSAALMTFRRV